uniref:OSJNBa0061G20.4 protein n=1 Tax=Oryza sativa subsp. japonica TaxID=39947 RepID=Q7XMF5_ORYSJ|nr:OSJNBa0061G20.4 [Oryza sativa Japonica Group]
MPFQLQDLFHANQSLASLDQPCGISELDKIIKNLPIDRAPGPDGFNGMFVKKCWPIICQDYYRLAAEFYFGTLDLDPLNHSFIILVPKKSMAEVLINGVPGKNFHCKRGVRQGAELLQVIINRAYTMGLLPKPFPSDFDLNFPIVQYADDTLPYLKASGKELFTLKALLQTFQLGTSLKVNFNKSCLIPINVDEGKAQNLAAVFGCQLGSLPFTYLGLPLGTIKPKVIDFAPLVDRTERRLTSNAYFLSYGVRLTLVNSVFSSLPTYYMCTLMLPKTVIDSIDRARRHCLWRGSEVNSNKKSLAAWHKVCKPKRKGGLGVLNLSIQNQALLIKFLDKFSKKNDLPWVNLVWSSYYGNYVPHLTNLKGTFWWRDICKLMDVFRGIARCHLKSGNTCSIWYYVWADQPPLFHTMSRLCSFAQNQNASVSDFLSIEAEENCTLPLSVQAFQEFQELTSSLVDIELVNENDAWSYIWGNMKYSSQKFYALNFRAIKPPVHFLWLWKCNAVSNVKVFGWLLMMNRFNTKFMLDYKNCAPPDCDLSCVLCQSVAIEDPMHLIFLCPFAQNCWSLLGITWDTTLPLEGMFIRAKLDYQGSCFIEKFLYAAWHIWKQRNGFIFEQKIPSFITWRQKIPNW